MSSAVKLPTVTELKTFQASLPDFQVPALQYALNDTDVTSTVVLNGVLHTESTTATGGFLLTAKTSSGYAETMWVPVGASTDGQTFTGVVRGIKLGGIDYTVGTSGNVVEHPAGEEVFIGVSAVIDNLIRDAIAGVIATGGTQLSVGDGASGTKTYGIYTDTGFKGIIRNNGTKTQYSDNGSVWTNISSVSASNLVTVSAADTTAGYLNDKVDVATSGRLVKSITNPAANEQLALTLATTLTDAEMNAIHGGITSSVTGTNLTTVTAGASSNADALHSHNTFGTQSYTAYEAISQYNAVALLPIETQWYTQLTDTLINLGDLNGHRRYATKYIPTATQTLTDWDFRAREAVNGATNTGVLTLTIQSDSAGAPSGTAITNATATFSQVTQRTWTATTGTRLATFAGTVSVTAGTTYWVVIECAATDAANYIKLGCNDTYVTNYLTFTRLTYDLDAGTWGNSSTTSIPFGWSNTTAVPFGYAICPTINTSGMRTWGFVGIATAAISAQASGSVSPEIATMTGLTPGTDCYISSSSGTLTTTPPTSFYNAGSPTAYSYKIGKALSSTVLEIQPGEKRIWGNLTATGSATTTTQLLSWFKMKRMEINGAYVGSATQSCAMSTGMYDGSSNYSTVFLSDDGGVEIAETNTNCSFGDGSGSHANRWVGVASALNNVGLTYTTTKTGTPSDFLFLWSLTA